MLDDLPSATVEIVDSNATLPNNFTAPTGQHYENYQDGIPIVNMTKDNKTMVYNHLNFTIETHKTAEGLDRIVGFDVEPMSIDWGVPCSEKSIDHDTEKKLGYKIVEQDESIFFTYSV